MIYLDNAATTRPCPAALDAMRTALEDAWGNPSALYRPGQQAHKLVEDARRTVARVLHAARPAEITFTSGGTESDVQALYTGAALGAAAGKRHIISTQIEHHAVLHTLQALQAQGFTVTLLPPSAAGLITPQQLADALQPDTCLVSIMFANNEIGTVQPIAELGTLCREHGALFHTDAVQAAGHLAIDVQATNIDLLSLSGHKFHGPKGAGALYTRRGIALQNVLYGGGQERGHRAGTENVPAIAGLAAALAQADANLPANTARCLDLRQRLTERLLAIPGTHLNGDAAQRLPGNVNITFDGVEAETLLLLLDEAGICASAGSACSAGAVEPQPCTAGPWPDPRPGQKHPAADAGCRQHGGRNRHRCRCDHRLRTAPARWRAVRRLPYFRGEMSGRASLRDDASIDPYRLIFKAIPPTLRNLPLTQHLNHPPTASELLYVCTKYFVQLSDFKILLLIFPKPHADMRLFFTFS